MERTLVVLKPDALQRGIIGDVISRFEKVGLKLIGAKMMIPTKELADMHYPRDRKEFIAGMGQKTLDNYKQTGKDPIADFGTDDPHKIGLEIQGWLVDFITSDAVLAMVWEGPHAVELVRKITGSTLPALAQPGTIRGDFSFDSSSLANEYKRPIRNLVHASGDKVEANFEVGLWFTEDELFDYHTVHQAHMLK